MSALAFKIMTDPFVGKLCFFRVYSGKIESGQTVYNASKGRNEKIGRIVQMHANNRTDIDTCYCGDIAAIVGVKNTTTGEETDICFPAHRSTSTNWKPPTRRSTTPRLSERNPTTSRLNPSSSASPRRL